MRIMTFVAVVALTTGALGCSATPTYRTAGGAANDNFVFKTLQDSLVAAPDLIGDFAVGDKINLSAIDANTSLAGDQAFHIGGAGGHAGDLVASYSSPNNITTVNLLHDATST